MDYHLTINSSNRKLSAIFNCQKDFEKVFAETKKEFEGRCNYFSWYTKRRKVSEPSMWLPKHQAKCHKQTSIKERPQSSLIKRNERLSIQFKADSFNSVELKSDVISFKDILNNVLIPNNVSCEQLSKDLNIERVIASVSICYINRLY